MKNSSKVLIALGAGAAIGAILGILFAPAKGEEIRKKITDQSKKLVDNVKDKFNNGREKFDTMKSEMKERMETVNEKVEELI